MKRSTVKISNYVGNKGSVRKDSSSMEDVLSVTTPSFISTNMESILTDDSKRLKLSNNQPSPSVEQSRCSVCWLSITDESVLKFHKKDGDKDVYSCTICFRQFCFSYQLAKHMVDHKKDTQCDLSEVMFGYLLKEHKLERHYSDIQLRCNVCWLTFKDQQTLDLHKKSGGDYSCSLCFRKFCFSHQLVRHTTEVHLEQHTHSQAKTYSSVSYLRKEHFRCDVCWFAFEDRPTLDIHKKMSADKGLHPCGICHRPFCLSYQLEDHKAEVHGLGAKEKYLCDICKIIFASEDLLKQHNTSSHNKQRYVRAQKYDSNEHLKKEHLRCEVCWLTFDDQPSLDLHKKMSSEKHSCNICYRPFCFTYQLTNHRAEVHGLIVKPKNEKNQCNTCKITFASEDLLKQHNASSHNPQKYVKAQKYSSNEHINKEHLRCDVCWATFDDQPSFDIHKKMGNEKAMHSCSICYRPFCLATQLAKHKVDVHGAFLK